MTSGPVTMSIDSVDLADLDSVRRVVSIADPEGRLAPIGITRIDIGPNAWLELPAAVAQVADGPRVAVVTDTTAVHRAGRDFKADAVQLLMERFVVQQHELGQYGDQLHADEETIGSAGRAIGGADCVIVIGSGTVTDICKLATVERPVPMVVVPTAVSVSSFANCLAVLFRDGVKRTVKARWPDAVVVDLTTIADSPPSMIIAGFGDLLAIGTAGADWYLAGAVGMDNTYHAAIAGIGQARVRAITQHATGLRRREPAAVDVLCRVMTLGGLVGSLTGHSASGSGTEHLISHAIDMVHVQEGRPCALHGAQVAAAAVLAALIWDQVLSGLDAGAIDVSQCFPDAESMEARVTSAFADLDPTGRIGSECWHDYSQKLAAWHGCRPRFEAFMANWPQHRAALRAVLLPAADIAEAISNVGGPIRFDDLQPPTSRPDVRWALQRCHLIRNRFTVLDLVDFIGWPMDSLIDRVLDQAEAISATKRVPGDLAT
jgi:glycerol-1-phosphate dehydrogenase [NAD(P)+]